MGSAPGSLSRTRVRASPLAPAWLSRTSTIRRTARSGSFHHLSGREPTTFMTPISRRRLMEVKLVAFLAASHPEHKVLFTRDYSKGPSLLSSQNGEMPVIQRSDFVFTQCFARYEDSSIDETAGMIRIMCLEFGSSQSEASV